MKSFEKQADTESKKTPSAFLLSSALLAVTLGLLAWHTQAWTISSIQAKPLLMNSPWLWLIGALFCLTALVQSAFFPFHNWLLSSLSSPSPICAFIHAACAPMGVFLLLRFQWIFAADAYLQLLIFFIGGLSAFFFSLRRLVQSDIKHSLGYSTLSQIGFMIMSCGLGVYTAAIAHLMLHSLFKAFQFLNAPSNLIHQKTPQINIRRSFSIDFCWKTVGSLSALFLLWRLVGKDLFRFESDLILIGLALLSAIEAIRSLFSWQQLSSSTRLILSLLAITLALSLYTAIFCLINALWPINTFQPFSLLHLFIGILFLLEWIYFCSGRDNHLLSRWLYMKTLNGFRFALSKRVKKSKAHPHEHLDEHLRAYHEQ